MEIWETQKIRTRGEQLIARGVNSIGYGRSRDQLGVTTINHLITPVSKYITESTHKSKRKEEKRAGTGNRKVIKRTRLR